MNISKKIIVAGLTLPLMFGAVSVYADGKKHGEDRHHCAPEVRIMHQLDLSDEQKEQMKALRMSAREEMKAYHDQNKEMRAADRETSDKLVLAETFDKKAAEAFAQSMATKQTNMMVKKMEQQHAMFSILTPEQKQQFIALKNDRSEECQEGKPRRGDQRD